MPWDNLFKRGWRIVGMNHYNVNGKAHLFCAMTKRGMCIQSESQDESEVFSSLEKQAEIAELPADVAAMY